MHGELPATMAGMENPEVRSPYEKDLSCSFLPGQELFAPAGIIKQIEWFDLHLSQVVGLIPLKTCAHIRQCEKYLQIDPRAA
jgi:hypothetical protein